MLRRWRRNDPVRLRFELQVPGNIDYDDALIAAHEKQHLQQLGALVVKRSLPPVSDYKFGNEDGDLALGMFAFDLENVIDKRPENEAIG